MSLIHDFAELAEQLLSDSTGREWLVQHVRKFPDDAQAPHFLLIVGEPGIGKSVVAARPTQIRTIHAHRFCLDP